MLDLLGAVWFAMGDLPQAGRHWWLTERDDEPAATARAAFYERFGTRPLGVLRALPRPAEARHYPASVAERLNELLGVARASGVAWVPRGYTPVADEWSGDVGTYEPGLRDWFGPPLIVIVIVGLLLVGLATTIGWVVSLFT